MDSLKDLYLAQIKDMHSADKQSLEATREMLERASGDDLRSALQDGVEGISNGIETTKSIAEAHGIDLEGAHCKGMAGLVKEAQEHAVHGHFGDDGVRDAMIVTQFQRISHYGIAGYTSLVALAKRMEFNDEADKLQECVEGATSGHSDMMALLRESGDKELAA